MACRSDSCLSIYPRRFGISQLAKQKRDPWSYLRDVLDQLAARSSDADVSDLLPDARAVRHARLN
jgi:hypothetical protein